MELKKYFWVGFLLFTVPLFFYSCKSSNEEVATESVFQSEDPVIEGVTKAISSDPNNADLYFQRAQFLYDAGNYEAAIADLESAIEKKDSDFRYFHLLSDSYLDYYQSGKALDIMKTAAEKFPTNIPTLLKLAELQLILKQYDASFFTIQKALNLDKQNAEVFFMMGMLYREQGESERAINSFQTAVELDPEIVDAWIILGDLFADKDFKIASRYYDNAIRLAPNNPQTYHAKAFYLQNKNQLNEAIQLYKKINTMNPQYGDAYLNTGILYLDMDSIPQALEHFNILVNIEPMNHLGYYYRGITKMFGGDTAGAKADLEQSLVFDPNFEKARQALAEIKEEK